MANTEPRAGDGVSGRKSIAHDARALIRRGLKATLATLDRETGRPYASLITVATDGGGAPLFLISTLAEHTKNLQQDARASILFDGTDGLGDPLEGGRVSVFGTVEITEENTDRSRFLCRHPSAQLYADFSDFSFYRLRIEGAHFVGGFGRIHDLTPPELETDLEKSETLMAAEEEIVAHMNEDHTDTVELYATRLLGGAPGAWRFTGCDPDGCDLVLADKALRLDFPKRVTSPQTVRAILASLAREARN